MPKKFLFMIEFGEIIDLAYYLKFKGHEVKVYIFDSHYKKIGDGMVDKIEDWYSYIGEGYTWVFDGCAHGAMQDWLRARGEAVFGGSEKADKLENDRQLGQKMFKKTGFKQPISKNFKNIDDAISFVEENEEERWILKQNGDAPKHINHMAKFDGNVDLLYHLNHLKKSWNEADYGKFDCDLMEVVEGTEMAASAFWNGNDWMKNSDGKVVGFLNFEEKKEATGSMGETCGEMGTTFIGCTEDNPFFMSILLRPEIEEVLRESGFRGVFDINGTITEDGEYIAFEPTCRFGVPATSYEFIEGMKTDPGELIDAVARGNSINVEIHEGVGMVMVVAAKPFPIETHLEDDATSQGERLWILEDGQPSFDFNDDQKEHIHLYNFFFEEDEETGEEMYRVATDSGYLLTVTGREGDTVEEVRENLIEYIKENIYISGQKWRTDIGKRIEEFVEENI